MGNLDYKWHSLRAPNASALDYKWHSLRAPNAGALDYKRHSLRAPNASALDYKWNSLSGTPNTGNLEYKQHSLSPPYMGNLDYKWHSLWLVQARAPKHGFSLWCTQAKMPYAMQQDLWAGRLKDKLATACRKKTPMPKRLIMGVASIKGQVVLHKKSICSWELTLYKTV